MENSTFEQIIKNDTPGFMNQNALNEYYENLQQNNIFFTLVPKYYRLFAQRQLRNWLYFANGYVPYFHSERSGIQSTKLGAAICEKLARKVVGSRIFYKNQGEEIDKTGVNDSLKFISETFEDLTNFAEEIKKAVLFAAQAGTAVLKINRSKDMLFCTALRFDSFICNIDLQGKLSNLKCFIDTFTKSVEKGEETYTIVEERYYKNSSPKLKYKIIKSESNANFRTYQEAEEIQLENIPQDIREEIINAYQDIVFQSEINLPFSDLGAELIKWTETISSLPTLPFGESAIAKITAYLKQWDYISSAMGTDLYTGRARVLIPQAMKKETNSIYNTGLDDFLYTKINTLDPDKQTPTPIQFDLRSAEWAGLKEICLKEIAVNIGINIQTLASFISDQAQKTAREISTEENETAQYVDSKRALIEKPINRIIKTILRYYGYLDTVEIRFSQAGLTNRQSLTEIISMAKNSGFLSTKKAVEMFNYDDDVVQTENEFQRILEEEKEQNENFEDNAHNIS